MLMGSNGRPADPQTGASRPGWRVTWPRPNVKAASPTGFSSGAGDTHKDLPLTAERPIET